MSWRNSISIDIDVEDILDKIDEDTIREYALSNNIVSPSDFDRDSFENLDFTFITSTMTEKDMCDFITCFMNRNLGIKNMPRNKTEMKAYINQIIDEYCNFN